MHNPKLLIRLLECAQDRSSYMKGPPITDRTRGCGTNMMMSDRLRSEGFTRSEINSAARHLNANQYAGFKLSGEFAEDTYYPTTGITTRGENLLNYLRG